MRRVLLYWRLGDYGYYQFLSRIPLDYIIPKDTATVVFYEAFIINDSNNDSIDKWELFMPIDGTKLFNNGNDLGQFINKNK